MILMDTHTLVWLDAGHPMLGPHSISLLNAALRDEQLAVCTISFWEIAMLIEKGRLKINKELAVWRRELLHNGLKEIVLCGAVAIRAAHLPYFHGDPADRIIVATALEHSSELVTADGKILNWQGGLTCHDARN